MQIAGKTCTVCEGKVILSTEGKFCARCQTVVHLACAAQDRCAVCGEPFEVFKPAKPDPLGEAILPRSLRPFRSGGPVLAGAAIVLLAFLVVILYYGLMQILARGH